MPCSLSVGFNFTSLSFSSRAPRCLSHPSLIKTEFQILATSDLVSSQVKSQMLVTPLGCAGSTVETASPTSGLSFVRLSHGCWFWVHGYGCDCCPTLGRSFRVPVDTARNLSLYPLQALLPATLLPLVLTQFLPLRLEVLRRPGFMCGPDLRSFLKMLFTEGPWPIAAAISLKSPTHGCFIFSWQGVHPEPLATAAAKHLLSGSSLFSCPWKCLLLKAQCGFSEFHSQICLCAPSTVDETILQR